MFGDLDKAQITDTARRQREARQRAKRQTGDLPEAPEGRGFFTGLFEAIHDLSERYPRAELVTWSPRAITAYYELYLERKRQDQLEMATIMRAAQHGDERAWKSLMQSLGG